MALCWVVVDVLWSLWYHVVVGNEGFVRMKSVFWWWMMKEVQEVHCCEWFGQELDLRCHVLIVAVRV